MLLLVSVVEDKSILPTKPTLARVSTQHLRFSAFSLGKSKAMSILPMVINAMAVPSTMSLVLEKL